MNEASHHLGNDSSSFHPVHSLIRAVGPPDLHHPKGRGRHSDLSDFSKLLQARKPEAIVLGHVLVGTGIQYINIPDSVKRECSILG
jgi:hypothetical protein